MTFRRLGVNAGSDWTAGGFGPGSQPALVRSRAGRSGLGTEQGGGEDSGGGAQVPVGSDHRALGAVAGTDAGVALLADRGSHQSEGTLHYNNIKGQVGVRFSRTSSTNLSALILHKNAHKDAKTC